MASVTVLTDTTGNSGSIYNVTMGVGPDVNGSYMRDDVMLVQYLLKKVWEKHANDFHNPLPAPPNSTIAVDGHFGPITANWILQYQQVMADHGTPTVADGRVDSMTGAGLTPIHQAIYTIVSLNMMFRQVEKQSFLDPTQDTDCPNELLPSLIQNNPNNPPFPLPDWSIVSDGSGGAGG